MPHQAGGPADPVADVVLVAGDQGIKARVSVRGDETTVETGGREIRFRLEQVGPTAWRLVDQDGAAHMIRSVENAGVRWLHIDGEIVAVRAVEASTRRARAARGPEGLEAPMPGAVAQVAVREGDAVAAGQPIVIIEAMKMEHVIRAPRAGRVVALRVRPGDQVEAGAVVAELRSADAPPEEPAEPSP
jgi:acetyl-CoA/propionyl-CoA carboxylase, biotin carboxylase, biotin carboxyl carrier protein